MLHLLPLVEVRAGESVHVLQSPSQGEARPIINPIEVVHRFASLGAKGFHVVDVDHSQDPAHNNDTTILAVLDSTLLPCMVGGGVRSFRRIQELLDTGARRVLVGTMGALHMDWFREAATIFGKHLVGCVDTDGQRVLVKGRTEPAPVQLAAHLKALDACGLGALHIAYTGHNGQGVSVLEAAAKTCSTTLSYQGPMGGPDDLARLERAGVQTVALGAEIYDGRLSFKELGGRAPSP